MKNLRAFKIETIQATNTKPERIKLTDLRFSNSVTLNYGATTAHTPISRSIEYLNERGIFIDSQAWSENKQGQHQFTLLLTTDFTKQLQ